jgi:putative thioredoxin
MVFDVVDSADFDARVIERSHELPVVVDFWAEWCAPCRALTPALEAAAGSREGKVELAKVDTDANQELAVRYGIQGIPAVKAFTAGSVAHEFTGALPPPEVERFFDRIVPSEADELARRGEAEGDEAALRRALELEPLHPTARRALGRLLVARGEHDEALELLERLAGDFIADGLAARARLAGDEPLAPAFAAWDEGDAEHALELLQEAISGEADAERRDEIRRVMVAIFTELGPEDPVARDHRRRLAATLS